MREKIRRAPEQLHAAGGLFFLGIGDDRGEPALVFGDVLGVIDQIHVVEAVVRHAQFRDEFKGRIHLRLGPLDGIARLFHGKNFVGPPNGSPPVPQNVCQ